MKTIICIISAFLLSTSVFAMDKYSIEGTPKTPTINFDLTNGVLEIKGRSIPENSIEFYKPLQDALTAYSEHPNSYTLVNISFSQIDEGSYETISGLLKKLENINKGGSAVAINWHYEEDDEDIQKKGEDLKGRTSSLFKTISVSSLRWKIMSIPIPDEVKR